MHWGHEKSGLQLNPVVMIVIKHQKEKSHLPLNFTICFGVIYVTKPTFSHLNTCCIPEVLWLASCLEFSKSVTKHSMLFRSVTKSASFDSHLLNNSWQDSWNPALRRPYNEEDRMTEEEMTRRGMLSFAPFPTLLKCKNLVFYSSIIISLESFSCPTIHSLLYISPSSSQTRICSNIVFHFIVLWDLKLGTRLPSQYQS